MGHVSEPVMLRAEIIGREDGRAMVQIQGTRVWLRDSDLEVERPHPAELTDDERRQFEEAIGQAEDALELLEKIEVSDGANLSRWGIPADLYGRLHALEGRYGTACLLLGPL